MIVTAVTIVGDQWSGSNRHQSQTITTVVVRTIGNISLRRRSEAININRNSIRTCNSTMRSMMSLGSIQDRDTREIMDRNSRHFVHEQLLSLVVN